MIAGWLSASSHSAAGGTNEGVGIAAAARAAAALPTPPFVPPAAEWLEVLSHPASMDASKAKDELGWEPRYDSLEALRDTLRSAL